MPTLGDAADVNPVIKFLPHTCKARVRDFRLLRYSSRDGHAEGAHVNRGKDTLSFCPTLQALDMSTLGDAADVNPVINLIIGLTSATSPMVDISSTRKVGQKLGVSLPLLTSSPSA